MPTRNYRFCENRKILPLQRRDGAMWSMPSFRASRRHRRQVNWAVGGRDSMLGAVPKFECCPSLFPDYRAGVVPRGSVPGPDHSGALDHAGDSIGDADRRRMAVPADGLTRTCTSDPGHALPPEG